MEQALWNILADATQPHAYMLGELFPNGRPTVDELVVALENELYSAMMPVFPGWEWDGEGDRNTGLKDKTGT